MMIKRKSVAMDDALWARLVAEASAQGRSVSNLIRLILTDYLAGKSK